MDQLRAREAAPQVRLVAGSSLSSFKLQLRREDGSLAPLSFAEPGGALCARVELRFPCGYDELIN